MQNSKSRNSRNKSYGFTLIEFLIAICIVGILFCITLQKINRSSKKNSVEYASNGQTNFAGKPYYNSSDNVANAAEPEESLYEEPANETPLPVKNYIYIISANSGKVIFQSVIPNNPDENNIGSTIDTSTSPEYLEWNDIDSISHRHYLSSGQIVHISNYPLIIDSNGFITNKIPQKLKLEKEDKK